MFAFNCKCTSSSGDPRSAEFELTDAASAVILSRAKDLTIEAWVSLDSENSRIGL